MWEEIFSLMFFISQRSIQLNVMAILLKANYFTYYRALQHKWRLDTLCLLLLISRKSRYSHLLLSAELWPEEFHAIVFCCPIGFINSVTLLIPLGNGSAPHTLYGIYITFNIMLKDIYYENYLFCWNKTVLHYVAEWDIILLAGNEEALIPTQGCSSFHIVTSLTSYAKQKTPVFYCAEPGQRMARRANPHLAEKGVERTWQDKRIL